MGEMEFQQNEGIILQETGVRYVTPQGKGRAYEAYLTTKNIYLLVEMRTGLFSTTKNTLCYPLNQIRQIENCPQVMTGKLPNGTPCLDIYMINGIVSLEFGDMNRFKIRKWIREIYKAMGYKSDDETLNSESTVGEIKGVVSDVMSDFGLDLKFGQKKSVSSFSKRKGKINKKCISCSAPLVGYKGQTVRCKYCDTEQTL